MLEEIKILHSYSNTWICTLLAILISISVLFTVTMIIICCTKFTGSYLICAILSVILTIIQIINISNSPHIDQRTIYVVLINDSLSLNSFYEKYNIYKIEGELYYIYEKENR